MTWPAELDLGGQTYRVLAFHPSQVVVGELDELRRRRLEARAGAGLLILAQGDDTYEAFVGTDYGIDPRHIRPRGETR